MGARAPLLLLLVLAGGSVGGCAGPSGGAADDDPFLAAGQRELRQVFRLGGLMAPEAQAFRREPPFVIDGKAFTYVLHEDLGRLAVFDPTGDFRHWIGGGRGPGPGEFTSAVGVGFVADTLWVRNFTLPRISRFLQDGTHLGTERVRVDADYSTTAGVQGISGYLAEGRAWMEPDGLLRSGAADERRAPFIVGDRGMQRQDTLFTWRARRGRVAGTGYAPIPEPPFHHVAPHGAGIVLVDWVEAHPEEVRIRILQPGGSARASWTFTVPPSPVPPQVRDSLLEEARKRVAAVRERVLAAGIPEEHAPAVPTGSEVREQIYLPEYYPPIRAVRYGVDGTVWLHRSGGVGEGPWVALDSAGTPLFRITLPDGSTFRHGSRESIWTTDLGEDDVPYLVRWQIMPPPR